MLLALLTADGFREVQEEAESRGMAWSALGASYLRYDRAHFIETLNDWTWFSDNPPPPWYSGKPSTGDVLPA
jgi:hypothetical protein